jgi:hypothetical protein
MLASAALTGCSKQGSSQNPPAASTSTGASTATVTTPSASAVASAAPTATVPEEPAPPADPVAPPGPVTPKLTLDTSAMGPGEWHVKAFGLPAVSSDGKLVAYLADKHDGMRGYANQALVVRAIDGEKVEKEIKLLEPNELNKAESAPNASGTTLPAFKTKAQGKVDESAAYLAKSSWIALARPAPSKVVAGADAAAPHALSVAGIAFELADGHLRAKDAGGKALLDQDAKAWAAKGYTPGPGQGACKFEPRLNDAAADAEKKVAFVRVEQSVVAGGDSCNADPVFHVYRLTEK